MISLLPEPSMYPCYNMPLIQRAAVQAKGLKEKWELSEVREKCVGHRASMEGMPMELREMEREKHAKLTSSTCPTAP